MSDQAIRDEIIEPMQRLFTPPKAMENDQQIKAMRDYMDALRGFSREELHQAWKDVRDSAGGRTWPTIATFVKAAVEAKKSRRQHAESRGAVLTGPRHPYDSQGWRQHFMANWDYIKSTELGKEAARDGWALMLKTALLGGMPIAKIEPHAMKSRAQRAQNLHATLEKTPDFPQRETLLRMWRGVLVERAKVEIDVLNATERRSQPLIPAWPCPYGEGTLMNEYILVKQRKSA